MIELTVHFFDRKPSLSQFSIEHIFTQIKANLTKHISIQSTQCRYVNSGLFQKLYNTFEVLFKPKGTLNHISGDVHYLAIFLPPKRTILTIHDVNLMYLKKGLRKFILRWYWLELPIKRSAVVTAISAETKKEILAYTNCPPEKIVVIPDCISTGFKYKKRVFNTACPKILQIGVKGNKNIPRLAEALHGISCKLLIVGSPPETTIQALRKFDIDFEWRANLSDEELIQAYNESDLLAFVSTFEGFGLPILEAQAVGRPVITSNVSSMPEVAGEGACLVNPLEPYQIRAGIKKLIEDENYRDFLIAKGLENAKRFKPQTIANQYFELYKKLAGTH